jgi:hypothetical protein
MPVDQKVEEYVRKLLASIYNPLSFSFSIHCTVPHIPSTPFSRW